MSSLYSQPTREDNLHNCDNIPLRDFNHPLENQPPQYPVGQNQTAGHKKTKKKLKTYKCTTWGLSVLCFLAIMTILALGLVYRNSIETPQTPKNGTVFTSIVTTTTSIPGKASKITRTLPQATQTLPPVTQTTVTTETEVSRITTEITKTSALTTTDTTRITVTPTKDPHDGKRCDSTQQYGGQELHDINSDYDLLLVDAIQEAVDDGMDIGDDSVLEVAQRSVFLCSGSHSIGLVEACHSGFDRDGDHVSCDSSGSYPNPSPTLTDTETQTSTKSSIRLFTTGRDFRSHRVVE